ncbi:hypothetical protein MMC16_001183 [Acarospora aff. strigata]|nr:hypothetical protein [Acarospora aff. strigata]
MFLPILVLITLLSHRLTAFPTDNKDVKANTEEMQARVNAAARAAGGNKEYDCFTQRLASRPLHKAIAVDCQVALSHISMSDKAEAPMMISRHEGFIVPHIWNFGTCSIMIDTNDRVPDMKVTLPLAVVVKAAQFVMDKCVADPPRLETGFGGFTEIESPDGSGGRLDVVVVGKFPGFEDPPPYPASARDRVIRLPSSSTS